MPLNSEHFHSATYPVVHLVPASQLQRTGSPCPQQGQRPTRTASALNVLLHHPLCSFKIVLTRENVAIRAIRDNSKNSEPSKSEHFSAFTQRGNIQGFLSLPRRCVSNASIYLTHTLLKYLNKCIIHRQLWQRSGKEFACHGRKCKSCGFDPWFRKIPQGRKSQPTLVFMPGGFHGQRSLAGYSLWSHKEYQTQVSN